MIQILIGGEDYSAYYAARSLRRVAKTGSDWSTSRFILEGCPVAPQEEQEVVIWATDAQTKKVASGRIRRAERELLAVDENGDEQFKYDVQVVGYMRDIDRRPTTATQWFAKTTGFIARDVILRVPTLDGSSITTGGRTLDVFEAHHENLTKLLDRLAKHEGRSWWVDDDKVVHFEKPGDSMAPFEIVDGTYLDIVGKSLKVEPDTTNMANKLTLFYKGKYSTGYVKVYNASNEITGVGTGWADRIKPGAKFRLKDNQTISYTVEEVIGDDTIRLSSNYAELTDASGTLEYVIEDIPMATTWSNPASIEHMRELLDDPSEDGVFADSITAPGGFMDFLEAKSYLNAEGRNRCNVPINIGFQTTSKQVPGEINAGQSVQFRLSAWGGIDSVLQIRQLTIRDGGCEETPDGEHLWEYDFKFETKLYDLSARLREQEKALVEVSKTGIDIIDAVYGIGEVVQVDEISQMITPTQVEEYVTPTETVALTHTDIEGPFYWSPASGSKAPFKWGRSWWG